MRPFTRVEVGLIRREGITKAAVDKIPISSTAYGLFAHETAKESPASETRQVGEVERPKLELTPCKPCHIIALFVGAKVDPAASETDLRTISDGDELTAYFCLCADSVCFLPFPVGHLTKKHALELFVAGPIA